MTPGSTPQSNRLSRPYEVAIVGADMLQAALPARPVQLAHAIRACGYDVVVPVSWGEELLANFAVKTATQHAGRPLLFAACPLVHERLVRSGEGPTQHLLALVSPPVATARYLRALHPDAAMRLTYFGSCSGGQSAEIDSRVQPQAFLKYLTEHAISLTQQPAVYDSVLPPDRRRFFSLPGGVPTEDAARAQGVAHRWILLEDPEFSTDVAESLLNQEESFLDVAPCVNCACAGAAGRRRGLSARDAVITLEPPRSTAPVVDLEVSVELRDVPATAGAPKESVAPQRAIALVPPGLQPTPKVERRPFAVTPAHARDLASSGQRLVARPERVAEIVTTAEPAQPLPVAAAGRAETPVARVQPGADSGVVELRLEGRTPRPTRDTAPRASAAPGPLNDLAREFEAGLAFTEQSWLDDVAAAANSRYGEPGAGDIKPVTPAAPTLGATLADAAPPVDEEEPAGSEPDAPPTAASADLAERVEEVVAAPATGAAPAESPRVERHRTPRVTWRVAHTAAVSRAARRRRSRPEDDSGEFEAANQALTPVEPAPRIDRSIERVLPVPQVTEPAAFTIKRTAREEPTLRIAVAPDAPLLEPVVEVDRTVVPAMIPLGDVGTETDAPSNIAALEGSVADLETDSIDGASEIAETVGHELHGPSLVDAVESAVDPELPYESTSPVAAIQASSPYATTPDMPVAGIVADEPVSDVAKAAALAAAVAQAPSAKTTEGRGDLSAPGRRLFGRRHPPTRGVPPSVTTTPELNDEQSSIVVQQFEAARARAQKADGSLRRRLWSLLMLAVLVAAIGITLVAIFR